jgi:UDP-N-acetylmuramoyl-tripeptide--D-alanyl-D-alanine ligase
VSFFEADNIRTVAGGKWLQRPAKLPMDLQGIGTDTREDLTGKAFLAIKGDRMDGHDYLSAAIKSGAQLLIVEGDVPQTDELRGAGVVKVDSTRKALARVAQAYRRSLKGTKVIAVTGSAGKTTTKQLIHALLSQVMQGSASPKSFNNDIGVPLTLLAAKPSDKFIVCEVGMNAPGEISALGALIEPDLAVITSIGRAHLGGFGSIEAIATEKASLFTHLPPNGFAIATADSPTLRPRMKLLKNRVLFGEAADADLRLTNRDRQGDIWWFEVNNRQRFGTRLPGKHNALNALAALAVARRLGLEDDDIAAGFDVVTPPPMRMQPQTLGKWTIYNDAYNANPDAMAASLETFVELTADAPRRVVILGDMLELGQSGPELHRELGRRLIDLDRDTPIAQAVFVGELSVHAIDEVSRAWGTSRVLSLGKADETAAHEVARLLRPGDAVLVKASRGIGLERIIDGLAKLAGSAAAKGEEHKPSGKIGRSSKAVVRS